MHLFQIKHFDKFLNIISSKRKMLAKLRAKWKQNDIKIGTQASRYFDLTRYTSAVEFVDDKTWYDLEFPMFFSKLDSTLTPIGSQVLYQNLRSYKKTTCVLSEQYSTYDVLRSNAQIREEIQLELLNLDFESNAYISDYIFGDSPKKSKYLAILPWWGLACALTLIAIPLLSWSIWIWLTTVAVNITIIFKLRPTFHRNIEILIGCDHMLRVADSLSLLAAQEKSILQLTALSDERPKRKTAKNTLGWISFLQKPFLAHFTVWLNVIFLAELIAYARSIDNFVQLRSKLASTFELVGSLDAAIAIASYLDRHPDHCRPEISELTQLQIKDGYHPFLEKPVKNSIWLQERSALITGSNMAGKTTFIKMIGINVILGRSLGFCLSTKAILPMSGVRASIRNEHSVESGKSNYFIELETIRSFITEIERGTCKIFLIDELFNGTNTVERLAIARAVLETIGEDALVLATTHDVELQLDLANQYDQFYFQEDPNVEGYFDWKIRSGTAINRNAIKLLEREGFPKNIVDSASAYTIKYTNMM